MKVNHWKKREDKYFLSKHPLCTRCLRQGTLTPATKVVRVLGKLKARCDIHDFDEYALERH